MARLHLILRYEHNHFRGWRVATKRRGKRFAKYFSDKPKGRAHALRTAKAFRDSLVLRLPPVTKIKRRYILNTTGVIGVARTKERTRGGKILRRYVASWPKPNGERGKASFSIGFYGETEARRLAVEARRDGLKSHRVVFNSL